MANPMQPTNLFQTPFASSGNKTIIPPSGDAADGRANLADGFPFITQKPVSAGGVAPRRDDFNGVLFMLSAFAYFSQSGGVFTYNPALSYDTPALVQHAGSLWYCLRANGAGNPVTPGTDEVYWLSLAEKMAKDAEKEGTSFGSSVQIATGSGASITYTATAPAKRLILDHILAMNAQSGPNGSNNTWAANMDIMVNGVSVGTARNAYNIRVTGAAGHGYTFPETRTDLFEYAVNINTGDVVTITSVFSGSCTSKYKLTLL